MPVSDPRIAVIGGGYAGFAAAVTLAERGVPVSVFEGATTLGGRARRVEHGGLALDNGLHLLMGCYSETLRLIRLVGGKQHEERALVRLPLELRIGGAFRFRTWKLPSPLHLMLGLLTARGLGRGDILAAMRFMLEARGSGFRLRQDMTVTDLLDRRRQPENARRYLWEAICTAALNTPPGEASAQVFLNVLRDSLNGTATDCDLLFARVDLSALLPEPATDFIDKNGGEVITGARVTRIERIATGFRIHSTRSTDEFTHVICACDPARAGHLLEEHSELRRIADALSHYRFEPIHSIYLQYPEQVRLPAPMFGLGDPLKQWAFDREALCNQKGLIGVVISASGPHETMDRNELARTAHRELVRCLGPLPDPRWHLVIAEKRATFACSPNLPRPDQATAVPGLFLAGDYTAGDYPATLEGAVRSGIQCARHILESKR
ncbi:MAG: FAD-dependent oxidoreductase [Betaproteobacteria bacterium]|nr:FAD-dependent oxidoreductase [Betaproteobacteria bacterium]